MYEKGNSGCDGYTFYMCKLRQHAYTFVCVSVYVYSLSASFQGKTMLSFDRLRGDLWTCSMWLHLTRRQGPGNCHHSTGLWAGKAGERREFLAVTRLSLWGKSDKPCLTPGWQHAYDKNHWCSYLSSDSRARISWQCRPMHSEIKQLTYWKWSWLLNENKKKS